MTNTIANAKEVGSFPPPQPRIKDMKKGEVKYTMAMAYNRKNGVIDISRHIRNYPGGSMEIKVTCVVPEKEYQVKYVGDSEYYYD